MKTYKITLQRRQGYWKIKTYTLLITPVYEHGNPDPVRHSEEWLEWGYGDDTALFYWEARFIAWRLKCRLEKTPSGEEVIYERKG
jgi:hypothetical protein